MNTNYFLRSSINPTGGFNRLSIDNPFNFYSTERIQNNYGMKQSNYSTLTHRQPKTPNLNNFMLDENKIGLKTDPKAPPMTNVYNLNTYNIRNEQKFNPYYYPNNYPQRIDNIKDLMNYTYSDTRAPRSYGNKTYKPNTQGFNSYSNSNTPKVGMQRSLTAKSNIPKSSRIPENDRNIYNNFMNYHYSEKENNLNNQNIKYFPETNNNTINDSQISNDFEFENNDKFNNGDQLLNDQISNNQYTKNEENIDNQYMNNNTYYKKSTEDINNNTYYKKNIEDMDNEFLNNNKNYQTDNYQRDNVNPQFINSARLPNTIFQFNNYLKTTPKNNFEINNNQTQLENNDFRYSVPSKLNQGFNSFQNQNINNNIGELTLMNNTNSNRFESKQVPNKYEQQQTNTILRSSSSQQGIQQKNGEIISDDNSKEFYFESNGGLVKSYGYCEDQNFKFRDYMEDEGKSVENLDGDPNKILFCLFDGHGGGEVSKFLQEYFPIYLKKSLPFTDHFKGFLYLFKLLDEKVKDLNVPNTGSTGTIIYIERQDGKKYLYCANVGDSRCVLVNRKGIMRLSYDDRVDDPNEHDRIVKQGGVIYSDRVYGQLMLSRSFGDWAIKSYGVIVSPHITRIEVNEDDLYLIIASDGVWDVIKDEECRQFCENGINALEITKNIIAESLNRGSQDNISCFAIKLR